MVVIDSHLRGLSLLDLALLQQLILPVCPQEIFHKGGDDCKECLRAHHVFVRHLFWVVVSIFCH
jgi:hypothetical protein